MKLPECITIDLDGVETVEYKHPREGYVKGYDGKFYRVLSDPRLKINETTKASDNKASEEYVDETGIIPFKQDEETEWVSSVKYKQTSPSVTTYVWPTTRVSMTYLLSHFAQYGRYGQGKLDIVINAHRIKKLSVTSLNEYNAFYRIEIDGDKDEVRFWQINNESKKPDIVIHDYIELPNNESKNPKEIIINSATYERGPEWEQ